MCHAEAVRRIRYDRVDAFNVYDRRVDRSNSEISKCILNQTMTIDSGSSLSQSEVHLEIFENVVRKDADFIRDLVNNKLFPFLASHGFSVEGKRFAWDDSVAHTPEQVAAFLAAANNAGLKVDPEYYTNVLNIPISGRKQAASESFF